MKLDKILVPTDFSHTGDAAMALATVLARDTGARIEIVHIEESPLAYGGGEMYYGIPEPDSHQLRTMLSKVVPPDPAVTFSHHLLVGDPANALARFAEEENVDMIVMGTHGRTGFLRLLMGSVAESVVRHAKCPVLTYKMPQTPKAS